MQLFVCSLFWILLILFLSIGLFIIGVLLVNHTRYCFLNCGTIDFMGMNQNKFNFGKITNVQLVFHNFIYFFLPIFYEPKHEGY